MPSKKTTEKNQQILVDLFEKPGTTVTVGRLSDKEVRQASKEALENAMSTIEQIGGSITSTMSKMPKAEQVEFDFNLKLMAEGSAIIAKTGAEASIGVKIVWKP